MIACANVADDLLLVRTEGRAQELAVRAALGAGRGRMAREMLVESLALALMGGSLGTGFAVAVVKLVLKISPARLPRFEQISVDATALLFTLAVSVAAGLAFGAIPAPEACRSPPRRSAARRGPQCEREPRPEYRSQQPHRRASGARADVCSSVPG